MKYTLWLPGYSQQWKPPSLMTRFEYLSEYTLARHLTILYEG